MSKETLEAFGEAVENGIWNYIEQNGVENLKYIDWFSIKAQSGFYNKKS